MTVGIYNPYHDSLGGGEQYMFTFALYFLQNGHKVIYFCDDPSMLKKAEVQFGIDLSQVEARPSVFEKGSLLDKINTTKSLDIFLFYSDGSMPLSFAKKTYIIFQFPVPWVNGASIATKIKKTRIHNIIVNSTFTKKFIDQIFSVDSRVIYPVIDAKNFRYEKKTKTILSVGRFTNGMNTKKHEILIEVFKEMCDEKLKEWKLIITGGSRKEDLFLVEELQKKVEKYPIEIIPNVERSLLVKLYSEAFCYWHASGFGVDEDKHPENVEHFGISTLEAMASGAIPFVYPLGGQREIVQDNINGFWWNSRSQLRQKTFSLIQGEFNQKIMADRCIARAQDFTYPTFQKTADTLFIA